VRTEALILLLAAGLDFLIGDPWGWPHPVRAMGSYIKLYEQWALQQFQSPSGQRLAGVGLTLSLLSLSGSIGWAIAQISYRCGPIAQVLIGAVLLASCFAGRSLRQAAEQVIGPLTQQDLATARQRLSLYVGRDTAALDEAEVLRATLETVSENTTDGVLAPLFYATLGALMPGMGALPIALMYKAASTLDSMVGYRESPYTDLGWFSARLEDYLTWLPCRLSVLTIALLSGHPAQVIRLCQRDAPQDPSPNAGWSECAFAAALNVQLGGPNQYRGRLKIKPLLGEPIQPIGLRTIQQALGLMRYSILIWLAIALLALLGFSRLGI
jgi:adenosylcobinamide-phosphate synthase